MNAETKAPTKCTVTKAGDKFEADQLVSAHKKKSVDRYICDLNQLANFLQSRVGSLLRR